LEARLAGLAIRVFEALACRDFARVDFKLDAAGDPVFLEINPLPTFAPEGTFGILAELEGCSLSEMLGRCLRAGLERLGLDRGLDEGRGTGPKPDTQSLQARITGKEIDRNE